jgi:hypothetical protein
MKRSFIGLLCALLIASFAPMLSAQEQQEKDYRFAVAVNPLFVAGIFNASFQVALSDTLAIPICYTGWRPAVFHNIRLDSVSAGLRIFPGPQALKGFYIGPFCIYKNMSRKDDSYGFWGFGLELGAMVSVGGPFFFDLGVGLARYSIDGVDVDGQKIPLVLPVFNMTFGIKF